MSTPSNDPGFAEVDMTARRIVEARARRARLGPQDREDLLQDVLIKYLRTWGAAGRPDNLEAWLETTTQHALIDALRRESRDADRRQPTSPGEDAADALVAALREQVLQPSLMHIREQLIETILGLVGAEDAKLIRRRFLWNQRSADIARELGISTSALDQRVSRAKRRLADKVGERPDLIAELNAPHPRLY